MMDRDYRDVSFEKDAEIEPLTGHEEINTAPWRSTSQSLPERLFISGARWPWVVHGILLSISFTLFAFSLFPRPFNSRDPVPFVYSPAESAVKYEIQKFDLPPVPQGPFVGKGPEVDAMWDYITDSIGDTMISREEMLQIGLDPSGALEITDPKTGKHGYRVAIEVFHQLHCLNLLRQNHYKSYYKPLGGDTADEAPDLVGHLDHCIDALRQFVMCQGDVNVFAFRFPFNDGDPWPDYTTPHVCRNYESLRQWAVEHTVPRTPGEPEH